MGQYIHYNYLSMLKSVPILIVFFSGFCSLAYQVLWDRLIGYNFGGDSISSIIVTSTFLLGLGLGAYLFGKIKRDAVNTYANIELLIGIYALISHSLFSRLSIIVGQIFLDKGGIIEFRFALIAVCLAFLLPVCILIGGTLPLIFNSYIDRKESTAGKTGLIYGINTLGACLGVIFVPFFLLNHISLSTSLSIFGSVNIFLSFLIRIYGRAGIVNTQTYKAIEINNHYGSIPIRQIELLAFVSGAISMSAEIIFFRAASVYWPSSAYNFPFVLISFLSAMSLGSIFFTFIRQKFSLKHYELISALFLLSALGLVYSVAVRGSLYQDFRLPPYLLIIAPFAFFQGGIFPLLLELAAPIGKNLPGVTGIVYLINSVGSFFAAIIVQFILFTLIGTKLTVLLLFSLGILIGTLMLFRIYKKSIIFSLVGLIVFIYQLLPITDRSWDLYVFGIWNKGYEAVEGPTGSATVEWEYGREAGVVRVNGTYMSYLPHHPNHIMLEVFPLSRANRSNLLVLGLGGGGMIRELAEDPKIKNIDVIDWSSELPKLLKKPRASSLLNNVLNNKKVNFVNADARTVVNIGQENVYDIVVDNLAITNWAGATNVKSEEYFLQVSRILKHDGLYVMDINAFDGQGYEGIMAGLVRNFKYVTTYSDSIVLSSDEKIIFDHTLASKVIAERKDVLNYPQPFFKFLFDVSAKKYLQKKPIKDDLLTNEYPLKFTEAF